MKDINKKTNKSIVGNSATIGWHVWWQGGINLTHYKKYCQISATIATLFFYMVAELRLYFIRFICCSATLPPCFYLNNNNNKKDIYIWGIVPIQGIFISFKDFQRIVRNRVAGWHQTIFPLFNKPTERKLVCK